ncbi:hypothetical protein MTO96_001787 [Rhipicephalus appendiculatus]
MEASDLVSVATDLASEALGPSDLGGVSTVVRPSGGVVSSSPVSGVRVTAPATGLVTPSGLPSLPRRRCDRLQGNQDPRLSDVQVPDIVSTTHQSHS